MPTRDVVDLAPNCFGASSRNYRQNVEKRRVRNNSAQIAEKDELTLNQDPLFSALPEASVSNHNTLANKDSINSVSNHCCSCSASSSIVKSSPLEVSLRNVYRTNSNRRLPAATIASNTSASARRHTVSNPRDAGANCSRWISNANSYNEDLAAAADTYFYFYLFGGVNQHLSTKHQNLILKNQKTAPLQRIFTKNDNESCSKFSSNDYYITTGTNYREFRNKFLTIRLCESCQKFRNMNSTRFDSKSLKTDEYINEEDDDKFSEVSTLKIIDFLLESSTASITPATSLKDSQDSSRKSSASNLAVKVDSDLCSEVNERLKNDSQSESFHDSDLESMKKSELHLSQPNLYDYCSLRLPGKTLFCPILTTNNFFDNTDAVEHHCCSCHNFCCCSYPDKLSYVLSWDSAAAAYIAALKSRQITLNNSTTNNTYFSAQNCNLKDDKNVFTSSISNLSFLQYPSLSLRLQVFNPHPERLYCKPSSDGSTCFFCEFKRQRQPNDEKFVKKAFNIFIKPSSLIKNSISTMLPTLTDISERQKNKQLSKNKFASFHSFSLDNNSILDSSNDYCAAKDNNNNNDEKCIKTSKNMNRHCNTSDNKITVKVKEKKPKKSSLEPKFLSSTSILTLPLLTIEEKILKLLSRFCNDPEEPNVEERCSVCYTRRASVRAYPCGHQALCRLCSVTIIKKVFETRKDGLRCVLCRRQIAVLRHQKIPKYVTNQQISGIAFGSKDIESKIQRRTTEPTMTKIDVATSTEDDDAIVTNGNSSTINSIFSTKIWPWNWS